MFRAYFLGEHGPVDEVLTVAARAETGTVDVPSTEPGEGEESEQEAQLGLVGSSADVLRRKSFASCTDDELAAPRRLMARLRLTPLDVSGSMADHSRALLQFAHSTRRVATARTHVYCFGTRLTCITGALRHRSPDAALADAGQVVLDWEGGTRIGDSLAEFVRTAGRRGPCRGAVVVICSDGLDRGHPEVLAAAMERLSRLCHRVVWCHPRLDRGRAPRTMGMLAAEPHVDVLARALLDAAGGWQVAGARGVPGGARADEGG